MRVRRIFFGLAMIATAIIIVAAVSARPVAADECDECICIDKIMAELAAKPEKEFLETLDGQLLPIKEYFDVYKKLIGGVIQPPKFVYWETREQEFPGGVKVRMYIYPAFSCGMFVPQENMDFGVAEVYLFGKFFGLILNLGGGVFIPMPHPVMVFEKILDPWPNLEGPDGAFL